MKTAISMPDDLFRLAEATARRLRVSRSELYAKAIAEYLKLRQGNAITERLNDVYSRSPAKMDSGLHRAQLKSLEWNAWSAMSEIHLTEPRRSEPDYRRPVLVGQTDTFNRSRIQTSIVAVIATNLELAEAPDNVLLPARASGLSCDSVVNVSQLLTLGSGFLTETCRHAAAACTAVCE